jgi:hypothetical protein
MDNGWMWKGRQLRFEGMFHKLNGVKVGDRIYESCIKYLLQVLTSDIANVNGIECVLAEVKNVK